MNTVKTTIKYGGSAEANRDGFKCKLTATVDDAGLRVLAAIGLASFGYRAGAAAGNVALGVKKSSETEYSEKAGAQLVVALAELALGAKSPITGGFDLEVEVERHVHVHGESTYAKAKAAIAERDGDEDELAGLAKRAGYVGTAPLTIENEEFVRLVHVRMVNIGKALATKKAVD